MNNQKGLALPAIVFLVASLGVGAYFYTEFANRRPLEETQPKLEKVVEFNISNKQKEKPAGSAFGQLAVTETETPQELESLVGSEPKEDPNSAQKVFDRAIIAVKNNDGTALYADMSPQLTAIVTLQEIVESIEATDSPEVTSMEVLKNPTDADPTLDTPSVGKIRLTTNEGATDYDVLLSYEEGRWWFLGTLPSEE